MAEDVEPKDWGHFQADIELKDYFPKRAGARFSDAVPEVIRKVFPDLLEDVSRRRNAAASLVTCGSVLEIALKALEEQAGLAANKKLLLVQRIDRLRDSGAITSGVAEWAHEIRLDRNAGAHDLIGDPELAIAYASFLKLFIEMGFEWPRQIAIIKSHKDKKKQSRPGQAPG